MDTFRANPSYFVELLQEEGFVLTKDHSAVAVVLSVEEFESMQAMIRLSGDLPRLSRLYAEQDKFDKLEETEYLGRLA